MKNDLVIIRVDGGICQQLRIYAYGRALAQKGFHIKFDLEWYDKYGKDINGNHARNFELLDAFPNLPFDIATHDEIELYQRKYLRTDRVISHMEAPAYIPGVDGHEIAVHHLIDQRDYFISQLSPIKAEGIYTALHAIKECNSCAVHVRRGDLATYHFAYGSPCSIEYFCQAIKIIKMLDPDTKFFFFSDEPEWIKTELIPHLNNDTDYSICDQNGSDAAYLDFYLITQAKHIIASKGTMGKYAKILNTRDGYIIAPNAFHVLHRFGKCILINEHGYAGNYSEEKAVAAGCLPSSDTIFSWALPSAPRKGKRSHKILKFMLKFIPIASWRRRARKKLSA